MAADKGMTMQEDGKNYGDFLLDTIEIRQGPVHRRRAEARCKESATEIQQD